MLRDAYSLFVRSNRVEKIVEEVLDDFESEEIEVPSNLDARVAAYLREHPELRWDEAVAAIAENEADE